MLSFLSEGAGGGPLTLISMGDHAYEVTHTSPKARGDTNAAPASIALSIHSELLAELGYPVPKVLALVVVEKFVTVSPKRFPKDGPADLIVDGFPCGSRTSCGRASGCWSHRRGHLLTPGINSCSVLTYKDLNRKIRLMTYIYLYRLKEHRERRNLTQEELAILSGVSRPTIAALELGYRRAHPGTTQKLAKALKVRPEYLLDPGH